MAFHKLTFNFFIKATLKFEKVFEWFVEFLPTGFWAIVFLAVILSDRVMQRGEQVEDVVLLVESKDLIAIRVAEDGLSIVNMPAAGKQSVEAKDQAWARVAI